VTTMQQNMTDNYPANPDWQIMDLISTAWNKVSGYKATLWLAMAIFIGIQIALSLVLSLFFDTPTEPGGNSASPADLIIGLVTLPMMYGLMVMGLHRANGEAVKPTQVMDFYPKFLSLLLLAILTGVLSVLGLLLLVLPGIYLIVAYSMAPLLLIERNMGVWEAMETSRKVVTRCWFRVFLLGVLMTLLIAISALPLGIGLIWTLPLGYILGGELFIALFGETDQDQTADSFQPTPPPAP
jgi:hypothetical protein